MSKEAAKYVVDDASIIEDYKGKISELLVALRDARKSINACAEELSDKITSGFITTAETAEIQEDYEGYCLIAEKIKAELEDALNRYAKFLSHQREKFKSSYKKCSDAAKRHLIAKRLFTVEDELKYIKVLRRTDYGARKSTNAVAERLLRGLEYIESKLWRIIKGLAIVSALIALAAIIYKQLK